MSDYPREESLICEALVREISKAQRWSAIVQANDALFHVRILAASLRAEHERNTAPMSMPINGAMGCGATVKEPQS